MKLLYIIGLLVLFSACQKDEAPPTPAPPVPPPYIPIHLDSSSFAIGNLEKGILDTFYLYFNKSVDVKHILLINNLCLPDLGRSLSNDGKTVKFYNLLCARLGNDYSFEFLVQDKEGKPLKDTATFSYYTRKLPTAGRIMNYTISDDNKYCWVLTQNPNQLYCLGLEDTTYVKKYDLGFMPSQMAINPYNQKFYILNYPFYTTGIDRIHVMNPSNGSIDKIITLTADQYDDPAKHLQVLQLAFGHNGVGVLATGTTELSNSRWRILDSRQNDTIYAHPDWIGSINGGSLPFGQVYGPKANYNKTKIYMSREYATPRGAVFDCDNLTMTELIYPSKTANHYIVPSKTQDKLFIASFLYQGIIGTGAPASYSQFDNRYSETADFSYRPNEQNFMYYRGRSTDYEFTILDYNKGKSLMATNVGPDFTQISATTNGKYVLALNNNTICMFDLNLFYKYL